MHTRAFGIPVDIAKLTNRFHATDFDSLDFVWHEEFLERHTFGDLVIPDLYFDAPVQRAACLIQVGRDRLHVAGPVVGNRFRRQRERSLKMLRNLTGAFARQALVISVNLFEPIRERLIVCMADQVQAHVDAIAHTLEYFGQRLHGFIRNFGNAGLEVNRRHEVTEFDGLEIVRDNLPLIDAVTFLAGYALGILHPLRERHIIRQVPFHGITQCRLVDACGMHCQRQQ